MYISSFSENMSTSWLNLCYSKCKQWSTFIGLFQSWFTNKIDFIFVTSSMWFGAGCKSTDWDKVIIIKSIVWKNYLKWYVSPQWHNYHYRMTMLLRALLYIGWMVGTLYILDDLLMGQDQLPRQLGSRGLQTWECQESRKHSWVHCSWQSISILRFCRQYSTLLQLFANLTNAQSNGYSYEAWGIKKCIEVDFTGN